MAVLQRLLWVAAVTLSIQLSASAEPIAPGAIETVDGDTIRVRGETFRLVGFDTPEAGSGARCEAERTLAAKATMRLRTLIAGGGVDLVKVRCACRRGTEDTRACNYGRSCGVLRVRGRDMGDLLIREGLARAYVCTETRCPARRSWCDAKDQRAK